MAMKATCKALQRELWNHWSLQSLQLAPFIKFTCTPAWQEWMLWVLKFLSNLRVQKHYFPISLLQIYACWRYAVHRFTIRPNLFYVFCWSVMEKWNYVLSGRNREIGKWDSEFKNILLFLVFGGTCTLKHSDLLLYIIQWGSMKY